MHLSHRTGLATWRTTRSIQSLPAVTTAPSRLDSSGMTGSLTATLAAAAASASTAGAMCTVWNAPATRSGRSRAPAGGLAANRASCAVVPPATICPVVLTLAGVSPASAIAASTSSSSPPRTAVIPVASALQAAAIASARTRVSLIASSAEVTPAIAPAASSPTLCPAAAPGWPSSPATARAAATSSGCATAVSVICSALPAVPSRIRSWPASSDHAPSRSAKPGTSSQGPRKPGACAPCPGAVKISTLLTLPCRDPPHR